MACLLPNSKAFENIKDEMMNSGTIDSNFQILDYQGFQKKNEELTKKVNKKYGTKFGSLFNEFGGEAQLSHSVAKTIDKIRENMETGKAQRFQNDIDSSVKDRLFFDGYADGESLTLPAETVVGRILENPELASMAQVILDHLPQGLNVSMVNRSPNEQSGRFFPGSKVVEVEQNALHRLGWGDSTILHELAHAITYEKLEQEISKGSGPMLSLYQEVFNTLLDKAPELLENHGMANAYEFVASIYSDKQFVEEIAKHNRTWYERLFQAIYKALGLKTKFEKDLFSKAASYFTDKTVENVELAGESKIKMTPREAAKFRRVVDNYNEGIAFEMSSTDAQRLVELHPSSKSIANRMPWYPELLENGLSVQEAEELAANIMFRQLAAQVPIFNNEEYGTNLLSPFTQLDIEFPAHENFFSQVVKESNRLQSLKISNVNDYGTIYITQELYDKEEPLRQELMDLLKVNKKKVRIISDTRLTGMNSISREAFLERVTTGDAVYGFGTASNYLPTLITNLTEDAEDKTAMKAKIRKTMADIPVIGIQNTKYTPDVLERFKDEKKALASIKSEALRAVIEKFHNAAKKSARAHTNKSLELTVLDTTMRAQNTGNAQRLAVEGVHAFAINELMTAFEELLEVYNFKIADIDNHFDKSEPEVSLARIRNAHIENARYQAVLTELNKILGANTIPIIGQLQGQINKYESLIGPYRISIIAEHLHPLFDQINQGINEQIDEIEERMKGLTDPLKIKRLEEDIKILESRIITPMVLENALMGKINDLNWVDRLFTSAVESQNPLISSFGKLIMDADAKVDLEMTNKMSEISGEIQEVTKELEAEGMSIDTVGEHLTYVEKEFDHDNPETPRERLYYINELQDFDYDHKVLEYKISQLKEKMNQELAKEPDLVKRRQIRRRINKEIRELNNEHGKMYHRQYDDFYYEEEDKIYNHPKHEEYQEATEVIYDQIREKQESLKLGLTPDQAANVRADIKTLALQIKLMHTGLASDHEDYPGSMDEYIDLKKSFDKTFKEFVSDWKSFATQLAELAKKNLDLTLLTAISTLIEGIDEHGGPEGDPKEVEKFEKLFQKTLRGYWNDPRYSEFLNQVLSLSPNDQFFTERKAILLDISNSMFALKPDEYYADVDHDSVVEEFMKNNPDAVVMKSAKEAERKLESYEAAQVKPKIYYTEDVDAIVGGVKGKLTVVRSLNGSIQKLDGHETNALWEKIFAITQNYREQDNTVDAITLIRSYPNYKEIAEIENMIEDIKYEYLLLVEGKKGQLSPDAKTTVARLRAALKELDKIQSREYSDAFFQELELKLAGVHHPFFQKFKGLGEAGDLRTTIVNQMFNSHELTKFLSQKHEDEQYIELQTWLNSIMVTGVSLKRGEIILTKRPSYIYSKITPTSVDHMNFNTKKDFSRRRVQQEFRTSPLLRREGKYMPLGVQIRGGQLKYDVNHPKINADFFNLSPALKRAHDLIVKKVHLEGQEHAPKHARLGYRVPGARDEGVVAGGWKTMKFNLTKTTEINEAAEADNVNYGFWKRLFGKPPETKEVRATWLDTEGHSIEHVHTPYTNRLEKLKDYSRDVLRSSLMYLEARQRTIALRNAEDTNFLLRKTLEEEGLKNPLKKDVLTGENEKVKGTYHTLNRLDEVADSELYGKRYTRHLGTGPLGWIVKNIKWLKVMSSLSFLAPVNNMKNWVAGSAVNFLESRGMFNHKTFLKAGGNIASLSGTYMAMKYGNVEKSKDFLLFNLFSLDEESVVKKYGLKGQWKHTSMMDAAMSMQTLGEMNISAQYIFAMMHTITKEVLQADGSKKKVSLYDSFEVKDGKISLKSPFSQQDFYDFYSKVQSFRYMTTGHHRQQSSLEMHDIGSILLFFRRFLVPALVYKFNSVSGNAPRLSISQGRYYHGSVGVLVNTLRSILNIKSEHQVSASTLIKDPNARRDAGSLLKYILLTTALTVTIHAVLGDPDDDDEEFEGLEKYSALERFLWMSVLKSHNELDSTSKNLGSTLTDSLGSILGIHSTIRDFYNLITHLFTQETYKTSRKGMYHKGDKKFVRDLDKVFFNRIITKSVAPEASELSRYIKLNE